MLQPHEIQVGSMIEYNGMVSDIIGITPPKPDKSKRFSDVWVVELGIGVICRLSDIKAIPLTEKILTDWCGFEKMFSSAIHTLCELTIDKNTSFYFYNWHKEDRQYLSYKGLQIEVLTLHHLQLLVLALTQQPLKITLP